MLVEQQAAACYRLAAAVVGQADAADATQEACLSAWIDLPSLRQADRFDAWLRSATCRHAPNSHRASTR